jgi:predicted metal-dependent hydrolase
MNADTRIQRDLPLETPASELVSHAHICIGDRLISYTLRRSHRRRSVGLTIDERGLRVSAPWRAGARAIENELRRHAAWVLRKLAEWQARRAPPRRWREDELLMLLGDPLRLTFASGPRCLARQGDRLIIGTPTPLRPAEVAGAVTAWLREHALTCFHARATHYLPALAVPAPEIRLSDARTRWGSCHAAGRILLNWRLVQMPLRLVDYVVVHELAHLREMNHSPRFWRTVSRAIPDFAERRKELRSAGHRYVLA